MRISNEGGSSVSDVTLSRSLLTPRAFVDASLRPAGILKSGEGPAVATDSSNCATAL